MECNGSRAKRLRSACSPPCLRLRTRQYGIRDPGSTGGSRVRKSAAISGRNAKPKVGLIRVQGKQVQILDIGGLRGVRHANVNLRR